MAFKILVVDDENDVRYVIGEILKRAGYKVLEASDGAECIKQLQANSDIDAVVLDIIMPQQDGIETLGTIKKQFPNVKLLMVSGGGKLNSGQYLSMALVLGADGTLAKPFSSKDLLAELDKLLL